jgi:predicted nucleotidyltransferase
MGGPAPDVVDRLREVLARTCSRGLVSAYLFGSHARGRPHRDSDVDVAVLLDRAALPTARERFDERVRLAGALGAGPAHPTDVVVLNDVPPQLGRRIVTEGVQLICVDAEADHAYVRDTLLRAADLEPFLRRMRRVKLAALAR